MRIRIPPSVVFPFAQLALAMLIVLAGCGTRVASKSESESIQADARTPPQPAVTESTEREAQHESSSRQVAKVEIASTEHDFGEMNPYQIGEHTFVVRNVGDAPLRFDSERSTCKCTVVEISENPVPPGGETQVVLNWQTTKNNRRFDESASLDTNDPHRPSLTFRISGDVLVHVGANPPELIMPGVYPGKVAQVTTVVTSQVWDEFRIEGIDSSLEGIRAELAPATPEQLEKLNARSGQQLTIYLPNSLPQGDFSHWVRFQISPLGGDEEPKAYELPLRGRVLRRLAVYGAGIDHTGTVTMGVVDSHQGHRHRLIMKVRDPDPELRIDHISCHPSFLQVDVTSFTTKTNTKGLYYLDIEVPKSTPVGRFQAQQAGEIKIHFDHPRISDLALKVDFAVAGNTGSPLSNQQSADQSTHGVLARRTNR